MKKFAAMLLAGMMSLSLLACGGGDDSRTPAGNDKSQTKAAAPRLPGQIRERQRRGRRRT